MWVLILRFVLWLWQKLAPVMLIVCLVTAGAGLYFFARDRWDWEIDQSRRLEALAATEMTLTTLRAEAVARVEVLKEETEKERNRYRIATRLIENLQALQGFWEQLFSSAEERKREQERLLWAERKKEEISWSLQDLSLQLAAAERSLQQVEARLLDLARERRELEESAMLVSYARKGWFAVRGPLIVGVVGFLAGPTIWKLFCYYAWAPWIGLGRPIRLREDRVQDPEVARSQVSKRVVIAPGERAVLKEKFLQASDEGLQRRTRFVFDWRIPFSSAACGLIELTEMSNTKAHELSVTFSTQEEPMTELSVVALPPGSALVLRPSHLAGVTAPIGERLRIERHWRLMSLHAWVTWQFRYFEFHGPCRLIVAGERGVRAERLHAAEGGGDVARRTNQNATIGFTPDLIYHSARAETFWAYYRGRNPLFDDLFRGTTGIFVCQEISTQVREVSLRRFWSNFRDGLLKVFGL